MTSCPSCHRFHCNVQTAMKINLIILQILKPSQLATASSLFKHLHYSGGFWASFFQHPESIFSVADSAFVFLPCQARRHICLGINHAKFLFPELELSPHSFCAGVLYRRDRGTRSHLWCLSRCHWKLHFEGFHQEHPGVLDLYHTLRQLVKLVLKYFRSVVHKL